MKKQLAAFVTVMGLATSMSLPTQAANLDCLNGQFNKNNIIISGKVQNLPEVKSAFKEWCEALQNGSLKDCPPILLPDCNLPNNRPEVKPPVQEKPEVKPPTTEQPDNKPDMAPPTTEQPENRPEVKPPTTEQPENRPDVKPPVEEKPGVKPPVTENNAFVAEVVRLVNEERAKAGLKALTFDSEIAVAADVRAHEIETSFSHTRPDGRSFGTALKDRGISYMGAGENIAWGQTTPSQVMQGWMNSEGHRANILNPKFTKIGVGHYKNSTGRNFWAQLFTY